jgi:polysaccharide biosynthesis/export protein
MTDIAFDPRCRQPLPPSAPSALPPSRHPRLAVWGILALAVAVPLACAMERPYVWFRDLPEAQAAAEAPGVIHPRDVLVVQVRDQAAMTGAFVVREDGGYLHPTVGNVVVVNRTPDQVAAELTARLAGIVVQPRVTVSIARSASARVNVVGEVRTPGAYELTRDRTVAAALASAGWLTDFASSERIFVVRNGEPRIRFRARDLTTPESNSSRFHLRDGDVVVVE